MKTLRVHKEKLKKIVESLPLKGTTCLLAENILATIWSYRNTKTGMYYSNEQLVDLFYFSERSIKNVTKAIKDAGLVDVKRRYNSSSTYKPSTKFYDLMKGHADPSTPKEKGTTCPSRKAQHASYTFSKEKEIEIANDVAALLARHKPLQEQWENDFKAQLPISNREQRIRLKAKILKLN